VLNNPLPGRNPRASCTATSAALLICSTCTVAVDLSVGDARIPTMVEVPRASDTLHEGQ